MLASPQFLICIWNTWISLWFTSSMNNSSESVRRSSGTLALYTYWDNIWALFCNICKGHMISEMWEIQCVHKISKKIKKQHTRTFLLFLVLISVAPVYSYSWHSSFLQQRGIEWRLKSKLSYIRYWKTTWHPGMQFPLPLNL